MSLQPGDRFWVPHEEHVFVPAMYKGAAGDKLTFDGDGKDMQIPAAKQSELSRVIEAQLEGVDNICALEEVTQAAVLHTVKTRYAKSPPQVYTRVARIMIAMNPFQRLNIYGQQTLSKYLEASESMDLPPHVFAIGLDAVNGLRRADQKNQAVLISGESGAGKTESTKLILSYIAEALGASSGGIQDRIMQTNPVLESFGNAMTVRNNNSSRFGKWLQMTVSNRCEILGCSVTDYLLELTRVTKQGEKERNYHVFFQLIQARNELKELKIEEASSYRYLKGSQHKAPGVDDGQFFEELRESFHGLGFSTETQTEIFKILMGILTIGNAEFVAKGEGCELAAEAPIQHAAQLLGVNDAELKKSMLKRLLVVGKDVTETGRTPAQAGMARDGLARLLYGRLFKFLISKINKLLSEKATTEGQYFGVLDIAGFESFEQNSIEQLFINLSNEHLQAHFNNHIFKMELDDYKAEGVNVAADLKYQDNSDIIALLDSKASILATLDEEISVPKASDQTFIAKVCKNFDKHPRLVVPKFAGAGTFGVRHFAGEVTYTVEGFLEKNVDKPPDEAPKLFQTSSHAVLKEIGQHIADELAEASAPGRKTSKTVSSNFRKSLAALVEKLNKAEPHFIRCIKPNQLKVPNTFTAKIVMDQLNCSGVFEAVRIRQSGFSSRIPFKDFLARYRMVVPKKAQKSFWGKAAPPDEHRCMELFREVLPQALETIGSFQAADIVVGKTKVFVRSRLIQTLDRARDLSLSGYVVDIQRMWRGHSVRKWMKGCRVIFKELSTWCAANKFYTAAGSQHTALEKLRTADAIDAQVAALADILTRARRLPIGVPREKEVEKVRNRMQLEAEAIRKLQGVGSSIEPLEIQKALARAKDLELPKLPEVEELQKRFTDLKTQVPLLKAMQNAIDAKDLDEITEVMDMVQKQELDKKPEGWIKELKGRELADLLQQSMEYLKAQQEAEEKKRRDLEAAAAAAAAAATKKLDEDATAAKAAADAAKVAEEAAAKAKAEAARKEEEKKKKQSLKNRKSTITGLTEEETTKIILELIAATETFDHDRLEASLAEALKQGVNETDVLKDAQELFHQMEMEDFLIEAMTEMQDKLKIKSNEAVALKSLQNLIKQAQKLKVAEEACKVATLCVQSAARARTRKTVKGTPVEQVDVEDMSLANGAFANLFDFKGLKNPAQWKGHKAWSFFSKGDSGPEFMLVHNKADLRESLTKVVSSMENQALNTFHNVLGWMFDRPVSELQRASLLQDIVDTALQDKALADEVYVQVMKQLTKNPSSRSMIQGWKLMLNLCQHVCPSNDLHEFVHVFLLKALKTETESEEAQTTIRQCISDLNITASPDKLAEDDTMEMQVTLIDVSTRKVRAPSSCTLTQLGEILAEQLRIGHPADFCFFQVTEGLDTHRLLPETAVISALQAKWAKLKEMTKRASRLLYKRRFLRVDEGLMPGDLAHATLTYRQALWDYLHYPIPEDLRAICEIAVRILFVERDHYKQYIENKTLSDTGILEQVVPEVILKIENRKKIATQVLELYAKVADSLDPRETRLVAMSRALSLMQRLKLFGAFYWLGKQIAEVPEDSMSVPEAPKQMCKVNPKAPDADYWIAVDFFGVRFVSVGSSGVQFQRGFLFNEEAVERVLIWGAKKNVVQFVVSTVNPAQPGMGRVPMTIAMQSPAAVDIAFAVHLIYQMKGMQSAGRG